MAFVVVWCGVLLYPMLHRHRRRQRRCWAGIVRYRLPIVFPVLSFPFLFLPPAPKRKLTDVVTLILLYPAHHLTRTGTGFLGIRKVINYLNFYLFATHTRSYLLLTRLHATQPPCHRGCLIPHLNGIFLSVFRGLVLVLVLGGLRDSDIIGRLGLRTPNSKHAHAHEHEHPYISLAFDIR